MLTAHTTTVKAAHIFPHSLFNASYREPNALNVLWNMLKLFWNEDRIHRWMAAAFRNPDTLEGPQDVCSNLITLCPNGHGLWDRARFALRPMAPDPDESKLDVEFHWQPTPEHTYDKKLDLLQQPASSRDLSSFQGGPGHTLVREPDMSGGRVPSWPICTGDVFTFTTADPERLPLPNRDLLEMQWYLHRVTAMSGAAEAIAKYEDDHDDDLTETSSMDDATRMVEAWRADLQ